MGVTDTILLRRKTYLRRKATRSDVALCDLDFLSLFTMDIALDHFALDNHQQKPESIFTPLRAIVDQTPPWLE